ncbi:glycerophosphodiester phosphodiesterase [Bacillus sp. 2205SS5-2]|uniref:glycerophosphodiester phosphodiesterase n=1 Tax=Bacillus sp. 2205SS5-2 TaxID=3109031 RepID=UPI0030040359
MTLIFAHRGAAGDYPENTMVAFQAALDAGADGIELDVQLSKEGEVVVIHDETLQRTTNGAGCVQEYSFLDLSKLQANYKFKRMDASIPSLKEVLDWLKGNSLICNIELKNGVIPYPYLEEKVIELIKEYSLQDRIILSSFNHYSIVKCYSLDPSVEIAPLYNMGLYMPWVYAKSIQAKGIHPKLRAAPPKIIRAAMEAGIEVRPYTVNREKEMKQLFELNCSAIITDYPKKAKELAQQYKKA